MTLNKTRGIWIAGNWKMNHGVQEAEAFWTQLASALSGFKPGSGVRGMIFPPFLSLERSVAAVRKLGFAIELGAQNAHGAPKGAFTGEVSAAMLKEAQIGWCLVGHSERRQFFGETPQSAADRARGLLDQGVRVVFCIGETRAEREAGRTLEVLKRQMAPLFEAVPRDWDGRLVIAYEPVWAIGTGLTATPEQAEEAHQGLRRLIWDALGMEASGRTPLLYGGSVTPENVTELLAKANIDGALIGGASLKAESFAKLLRAGAAALT